MTRLTLILIIKIVFTIVTVAAPFLLLSPERIAEMLGATAPSPAQYRLYGVAMIALLAGYAFAIPMAQRGERPMGPLVMGVISNGGAAITLLTFGVEGTSLILAYIFAVFAFLLGTAIFAPDVMLRTIMGSVPSLANGNDRAVVYS